MSETVSLAVAWLDDPARTWRLESRGKRCTLEVTVRVHEGAGAVPRLEWRQRRVGGFGTWQTAVLTPGEASQGFRAWKARTDVEAEWFRTRRIDVRCTIGDQLERVHRIVVSRGGYYTAIALSLLSLCFVAAWLEPLPPMALALGLGVSVLSMGLGALGTRLVQVGTGGPLSGLGVVERAYMVALIGPALALYVPPLTLVVVENNTSVAARALYGGKSMTLAAGERRVIPRWDLPMTIDADASTCACPSEPADPSCPCTAGDIHAVPLHRVVCRQASWNLGTLGENAKGLIGAEARGGVVWRKMKSSCEPAGEMQASFELGAFDGTAGSAGTVDVWPPWHADFASMSFEAAALAPEINVEGLPAPIAGAAAAPQPVMRAVGLEPAGARVTIPLFDPSWVAVSLELHDIDRTIGTLRCRKADGLGGKGKIDVISFDAKSKRATVRTGVSSEWTGESPVRVCVTTGRSVSGPIALEVAAIEPGTVITLPRRLQDAALELTRGGSKTLAAAPCDGRFAIIAVEPAEGTAPPTKLTSKAPPLRTWVLDAVQIGGAWRALICNPPDTEIAVKDGGGKEWRLGEDRARRVIGGGTTQEPPPAPPIPLPTKICQVWGGRLDQPPTFPDTCKSNCRPPTAADMDPDAVRLMLKKHRCTSACFCPLQLRREIEDNKIRLPAKAKAAAAAAAPARS